MQNQSLAIAVLVSLSLLAGCASGPTIISNSDPEFDFSDVRTFAFAEPLATDSGNVRSLMSTQLIAATSTELENMGWRRVDAEPDILVDFLFETQDQIRTRNPTASVSTMHRGGRYAMWGAGIHSTPTIETVTNGALSIDLADPTRNQLIWEGTATQRVTNRLRANQEAAINEFVSAIMATFP